MMADRVKGDTNMAASPGLQTHNVDIPTQSWTVLNPWVGYFPKKKTMVPHKKRSENFVTFHATIGQVYDANTKLLGVFFRQKDTWVGTLGLKRCLPMLGYENLEWKQTLILLALTIKTRKQAIAYATVIEKRKRKRKKNTKRRVESLYLLVDWDPKRWDQDTQFSA